MPGEYSGGPSNSVSRRGEKLPRRRGQLLKWTSAKGSVPGKNVHTQSPGKRTWHSRHQWNTWIRLGEGRDRPQKPVFVSREGELLPGFPSAPAMCIFFFFFLITSALKESKTLFPMGPRPSVSVGAMGEVTRLSNFSNTSYMHRQWTLAIKKENKIMYYFSFSFKFQQPLKNHVQIYFGMWVSESLNWLTSAFLILCSLEENHKLPRECFSAAADTFS